MLRKTGENKIRLLKVLFVKKMALSKLLCFFAYYYSRTLTGFPRNTANQFFNDNRQVLSVRPLNLSFVQNFALYVINM